MKLTRSQIRTLRILKRFNCRICVVVGKKNSWAYFTKPAPRSRSFSPKVITVNSLYKRGLIQRLPFREHGNEYYSLSFLGRDELYLHRERRGRRDSRAVPRCDISVTVETLPAVDDDNSYSRIAHRYNSRYRRMLENFILAFKPLARLSQPQEVINGN